MPLKQRILKLYKNRGETPLECMNRFKIQDSPSTTAKLATGQARFKDMKMTYAGRLDPLAEGLLIALLGEECKNKEKYLNLDKEYEVDVLFGFSTDTYDVLGKVTSSHCEDTEAIQSGLLHIVRKDLQKILKSFVGRFSQKYPAYSSKFWSQARSGELDENEIGSKDVEIKNIEFLGQNKISINELAQFIKDSINLVSGDFRQEEILESWKTVFASEARQSRLYQIISIKVNCTSGTYMRSLASSIGEKLGVPALALRIKRTRVGEFILLNET